MKESALVQEGDTPVEDVIELNEVYLSMMASLETLIIRINRTNSQTMLDDLSLADAITKRDCLKAKIAATQSVRGTSIVKRDRYSRAEIKYVRTVDITKLQSIIDDYSRQYRELDTRIQARNWTAELL